MSIEQAVPAEGTVRLNRGIQTRFLFVAFLMDMAGLAVSFPIPWIADKLGANPLELGIAAAAWSVTYTSLSVFFGHSAERWGYKRLPLLALGIMVSLCCLVPITGNLYLLIAEAMGMGACFAMFWTPVISWLSGFVEPDRMGPLMSRFSMSWNAGAMLGLLFSGNLFEWAGWLPFAVGAAIFVSVGWLLVPIAPLGPFARQRHEEASSGREEVALWFLYLAWFANFLAWAAVGMVSGLFPELAKLLRIGPALAGVLLFIACAARVGILLSLQWRTGWQTRLVSLLLAQGILAVGLLFVAEAHQVSWLVFGMVGLGIASGMTYLISIHASLNASAHPSRNVGFHEAFLGAGSLLGPAIGGAIVKFSHIRAPYRCMLVFMLSMIAVQWLRFGRRKNR
ncbi:MAG: MFS transporter [Armatimonadetes bacterium]|nr:MFS transporter [Armatimonadota bacterium]